MSEQLALRAELQASGIKFKSETDSEVLAHLVRRELNKGGSLADAVRAALRLIEGSYALVVVDADEHRSVGLQRRKPYFRAGPALLQVQYRNRR